MGRSLTWLAVGTVAVTILGGPAPTSAAENKDVRIVNTAEEAVPVAVQGTPTVHVASLPTEPFQKHVGNVDSFDVVELTTVPAGKQLVIEYINAFAGGTHEFDHLTISTSDGEGGVVLAFRFVSGFVDTHPRIIVGPGRTVSARNMAQDDATLTVSGHYEPAPIE